MVYPIIHRVLIIQGGAGFRNPSTVSQHLPMRWRRMSLSGHSFISLEEEARGLSATRNGGSRLSTGLFGVGATWGKRKVNLAMEDHPFVSICIPIMVFTIR